MITIEQSGMSPVSVEKMDNALVLQTERKTPGFGVIKSWIMLNKETVVRLIDLAELDRGTEALWDGDDVQGLLAHLSENYHLVPKIK